MPLRSVPALRNVVLVACIMCNALGMFCAMWCCVTLSHAIWSTTAACNELYIFHARLRKTCLAAHCSLRDLCRWLSRANYFSSTEINSCIDLHKSFVPHSWRLEWFHAYFSECGKKKKSPTYVSKTTVLIQLHQMKQKLPYSSFLRLQRTNSLRVRV